MKFSLTFLVLVVCYCGIALAIPHRKADAKQGRKHHERATDNRVRRAGVPSAGNKERGLHIASKAAQESAANRGGAAQASAANRGDVFQASSANRGDTAHASAADRVDAVSASAADRGDAVLVSAADRGEVQAVSAVVRGDVELTQKNAQRGFSGDSIGSYLVTRSIEAVQPVAREGLALGRALVQRVLHGTPSGRAGNAKLLVRVRGFARSVVGASRKLAPIVGEVYEAASRVLTQQ